MYYSKCTQNQSEQKFNYTKLTESKTVSYKFVLQQPESNHYFLKFNH